MKSRLLNLPPRDSWQALVVIFFATVVSLSIASANSPLFGASRPLVASFTPISGSAGTTVTITGANFSAVTDVRFNNVNATFTVDSAIQITAVVPSGATTGAIVVTTSAGTTTSATSFIVGVSIPSGIRFMPVSGTAGASVTITGSGFSGATSVMFNGTPAAFTVDSSTQITAVVPSGAATGAITVTNSEGSASSMSSFTVGVSRPVIQSFSPLSAEAGALVTISGENLTGATSVQFNNAPAIFLVTSSTQITASVPIGATTGAIAISTAAGTTTSGTSFTVGVALPAIQTFEPASGEAGASVTITGSNFTSVTQVRFNESPASFIIDSESQITATVPAGAATGAISVQSSAGTNTSSISFVIGLAAPSITSFSPSSATAGASVTITGTNLSGALSVTFNGTPASFVVDSSTQITATVPAEATSGSISVATAAGQASSSGSFTIGIVPPSIGSFSPVSGSVGSTVTLTGTGFDMTLTVKFNGGNTSFVVDSSTQITATVPASASAGPITVTTLTGTATSTSSFQVADSPPSITNFSPTSGSAGTDVTISGTNFSGTTQVQFNGTNANFRVDSSTQITATVPSGATTGPISVTTPAGTAASSSNFSVGNVAPTITGFTPANGAAGTQVSITGSNFAGVTQVQFNGTNASFTVVSSQEIKATVPPGATSGPITVTTSAGAATSSSNFTATGPLNPVISDFSPSSGAAGTVVTINGANFAGTTSVKFNGTDASFMVNSSAQISATTPASATTGPITVTTVSGNASSPSAFTVVASSAPTIAGFSPTSGAAGTQVIITGTNFSNVTAVRFNGTSAGFTVNSSTQITATVPAGATSGPISVTTTVDTAVSASNFQVIAPIVITRVTFHKKTLTILGNGFEAGDQVKIDGVLTDRTVVVVSSDTIIITGKRKELRIKPARSMHTYQVVRGTGSSNVFASAAPKT